MQVERNVAAKRGSRGDAAVSRRLRRDDSESDESSGSRRG